MKRILLIGDSIRVGYDQYVKRAFEGVADVVYPEDNCRFTGYVLRHLIDWKKELGCGEDVDLVHFNAGLWDDLVMVDGKNLTSIQTYEENIGRICDVIRILFPAAKMIFATSTPVQEHLFLGPCKRYNADTRRYNEVAVRVATAKGASVNDLYALLEGCPTNYYSDLTHFYTKEGTRCITEQVVSVIEQALGIKGKTLDYAALFDEKGKVIGI